MTDIKQKTVLSCKQFYNGNMRKELLEKLSRITPEEKEILAGNTSVNRALYYSEDKSSEIDAARVLENGKRIDLRPHTRFIHFPKHTHNYIEFIYMVQGSTTHIIDDETIVLSEGDLLFLNQHAVQEIYPAGKNDIAVNFMILPSFFDDTFEAVYAENSALKDFIVSCLTSRNSGSNYLYFKAGNIIPVQNLLENLVWNLLEDEPNKRSVNQLTMSLLFLSLVNHADRIVISGKSFDQNLALEALRYINENYAEASLKEFAYDRKMDVYTVSRIIKNETGSTFKNLLEEKRMNEACFLLKNTPLNIEDIALHAGYENLSFFYRLFQRKYGMTPRDYRISNR